MKEPGILRLYDAAWRLALGPLRILAWMDVRLRKMGSKGFLPCHWRAEDRLPPYSPDPARARLPVLWMHGASLGESKGLWALAESLLEISSGIGSSRDPVVPGYRILLTVNTSEGLDYLQGRVAVRARERGVAEPDVEARIAPLDHPDLMPRFLREMGVAQVGLYEVELWPNFIRAASALGIPVVLVSGRMTERALGRYRFLRRSWSSLLDRMEWIQAQGELDAARFRSLTKTPVEAGIDYKSAHYLRSPGRTDARPGVGMAQDWDPALDSGAAQRGRFAFISLHLAELEWFLPELPGLMERFPLTIFPRRGLEMESFRKILLPMGFETHARSPGARHVLVDSFGHVGGILPQCGSAFVGGSLAPLGCHNLWEPLLAGLKIYFGPSIHNQEGLARILLEAGVAEIVGERSRVREWRKPDAGISGICADLVGRQRLFLETSGAAVRARLETAMSRFYLFSGTTNGRQAALGRENPIKGFEPHRFPGDKETKP